jgi:SAM-dependent methyltransferase
VSGNAVRDIHDEVADSDNPVEASVRPPGTTHREMEAMRCDVLNKLRLAPHMDVVEIGCGIGLLGVPVAKRARRYVGLDFAPRAVRVANERLRDAGVGERARALCMDVLQVEDDDLRGLGRFDRVLMYAVLHYARSEQEAVLFLRRAVDLLAPGGRALIGNVPLGDLQADWPASARSPRGLLARMFAVGRWVATPGTAPVPLTRRWKARRVVETALKTHSSVNLFAPARLPANYTIALTTASVERWLGTTGVELTYHWELPAPGVPLAPSRADLIVIRH